MQYKTYACYTFSEIVRDHEFEGEGVGVYGRVWRE